MFHEYLHFQFREILLRLVFVLVLVKSIQHLLVKRFRNIKKLQDVGTESSEKGGAEAYSEYKSLPRPKPFPIRFIGNMFQFLKTTDVMKTCLDLALKYKECVPLVLFGQDYVLLTSPQTVQALLTSTDNGHLGKGGLEEMLWPKRVRGLVSYTGEQWRTRRKMLNRSFTYTSLQQYSSNFNRNSEKLVSELGELFNDGKVHHIDKIVNACVFRFTSETLMGVGLNDSDGEIFCEGTEVFLDTAFQRVYRPWLYPEWAWRLHPLSRKADHVLDKMGEVAFKIIKKHSEKMDNDKPLSTTHDDQGYNSDDDEAMNSAVKGNIVEVLLHHGLSEENVFMEVAALLGIAFDTTSLSLVYALFLFALNPDHQEKCREEIDTVFSDPLKYKNGAIDYNALTDLKYLERCILEVQRVYPLGSAMRKLETPLRLSKDLVIPAGVTATILAYTLHMNPNYFPNPEKFDPDRFLPENVKSRHPYAFIPFSGGPRSCIGMKLALIEMKVALAKILFNYEVSTPDTKEDVKIVLKGLPKPAKPINFIFRKRSL